MAGTPPTVIRATSASRESRGSVSTWWSAVRSPATARATETFGDIRGEDAGGVVGGGRKGLASLVVAAPREPLLGPTGRLRSLALPRAGGRPCGGQTWEPRASATAKPPRRTTRTPTGQGCRRYSTTPWRGSAPARPAIGIAILAQAPSGDWATTEPVHQRPDRAGVTRIRGRSRASQAASRRTPGPRAGTGAVRRTARHGTPNCGRRSKVRTGPVWRVKAVASRLDAWS